MKKLLYTRITEKRSRFFSLLFAIEPCVYYDNGEFRSS